MTTESYEEEVARIVEAFEKANTVPKHPLFILPPGMKLVPAFDVGSDVYWLSGSYIGWDLHHYNVEQGKVVSVGSNIMCVAHNDDGGRVKFIQMSEVFSDYSVASEAAKARLKEIKG
jgi:hypothetical protein